MQNVVKIKPLRDTVLFILTVFLASFLIQCYLYPDLCLHHTRRLLIFHETLGPFESSFILVAQFFHGGVQLWDRFDQMNNAYFVLSNGVYGVANIITALVFILLSPFFTDPMQALYHVHLICFYSVACLIRTVGGYVLLRKFISDKAVIFVSLVYLNTILTSYMMAPGIVTQGVYSFLPLLLYYILCFFEDFRLRTFILAALVMCLCFVNAPLFTLGYFYQAVHFFLLICVVIFLLQRGWRRRKDRPAQPKGGFWENAALMACCSLIIWPYLGWARALVDGIFEYGSGLGGTQGRFNNIFKLSGYFNVQGKSFANPLQFLGTSLDYTHNVWGSSWLFIGAGSLILVLAALVLSRDKRKHIFWITVLCLVLINTACFPENFFALGNYIKAAIHDPAAFRASGGIHAGQTVLLVWLMVSSIVHGINALTNPFSFLVRSFHMASMLISILLLPLVAMGLDAIFCLWQRRDERIYLKRGWLLTLLLGLMVLWAWAGGTDALEVYTIGPGGVPVMRSYVLVMTALFFLWLVLAQWLPARNSWLAWIIVGFVFLMDLMAVKVYASVYAKPAHDQTGPCILNPSYSRWPVVPDYQNPQLLPFREFLNTDSTDITPEIYSSTNMYGAFYQYTPIGRFFHPWSIYEPRHKIYEDLYPDQEIQEYLTLNPRTFFFADYAFDLRYLTLADIMHAGLARHVVIVEPREYNRAFLKTAQRVYVNTLAGQENFYRCQLQWSRASKRETPYGSEYIFDLPGDFPFYLSTTVFTQDYASWQLSVGDRVLSPMQGTLTAPWTYDVQNIHRRRLTVLLPGGMVPAADVRLQVKLPQGIRDVWKNTYDDLGFTYEAPRSGWLVFHYPYDEKWELIIDGVKTPVSRVNRYFMGVPIAGGEHRVLLRYWPHTLLRFWIFISMMLSLICFFKLMAYSLQREPL